ncbi:MAG: hypothetical protein ACYCOU_01290 [Sulfobacillus sp.]
MGLTCECGDDDYDWWFITPTGYVRVPQGKKCCSCAVSIDEPDAVGLEFECFTFDEDGEEEPMETRWMCETCGDLYFSLLDLGFCISIEDNMVALVREYAEMQREVNKG